MKAICVATIIALAAAASSCRKRDDHSSTEERLSPDSLGLPINVDPAMSTLIFKSLEVTGIKPDIIESNFKERTERIGVNRFWCCANPTPVDKGETADNCSILPARPADPNKPVDGKLIGAKARELMKILATARTAVGLNPHEPVGEDGVTCIDLEVTERSHCQRVVGYLTSAHTCALTVNQVYVDNIKAEEAAEKGK